MHMCNVYMWYMPSWNYSLTFVAGNSSNSRNVQAAPYGISHSKGQSHEIYGALFDIMLISRPGLDPGLIYKFF